MHKNNSKPVGAAKAAKLAIRNRKGEPRRTPAPTASNPNCKVCTACGEEKSLADFTKDKAKQGRYSSYCRSCRRVRRITHAYGITAEQYEVLHEQQRGCCAICGDRPAKGLDVDHCHERNVVRGLLCGTCNRGIGLLKESPSILRSAIAYLGEHV